MDKEKLMAYLNNQIEKYDKMASQQMESNNIVLQMHFNGHSTALWLVKNFIELNEEENG